MAEAMPDADAVYRPLLTSVLQGKSAAHAGTAVFNGGGEMINGDYVSNWDKAKEWVKAHPDNYMLYDTEAGQFLRDVVDPLMKKKMISEELAHELGIKGSQMMAQQAQGNVNVFSAGVIRDESTLTSFELIELLGNNPKVPTMNHVPKEEIERLAKGDPLHNWQPIADRLGGAVKDLEVSTALAAERAAIEAETAERFVKVTKIGGAAGLGIGPMVEGGIEVYHAYKNNEHTADIALKGLSGANNGLVDTFVPGARTAYADVRDPKLTSLDRWLNGADHATATATAFSATATVAGVETGPLDIAPALATAVSAAGNLGVNVVKAGLAFTGAASPDQKNNGYVYDGIVLVGDGAVYTYEATKSGLHSLSGMLFGGQDTPERSRALLTPPSDLLPPVTERGNKG